VKERECLNCGETRSSLKRQGITMCGIEEGYEYRELAYEFPHHRWADWTDSELARQDVKPEAFDKHRRAPALHFQWIGCEDTVRGHVPAAPDDVGIFVGRVGQCILCGKDVETEEAARCES